MDDLISRAAAIDALHMDTSIIPFKKAREYADATISEIRNRLEKLPSAQPELAKDINVHSKDCISRQAAIDALEREKTYCTAFCDGYTPINVFEKYNDGLTDGIKALKNLPSAQPEPLWIPWDSGRLPDDSGTYIVTAYDGVQERVTFAKYQKRLKRWELTGARAYWRVLAWLPLPEPYAERRTDERCS